MKPLQTLIRARLKLRKRHISEWNALIDNQLKVWQFVKDETAQKLSSASDDRLARATLKNEQGLRLVKIMTRQREERKQMKTRHQEEESLLEAA